MKHCAIGTEIISYHGNPFIANETEDIHSWKSGGLIYPMEILALGSEDNVEVMVKIMREDYKCYWIIIKT